MGKKMKRFWAILGGMPKPYFSKRMRFWSRFTLFMGVVVAGLHFIFDPATPKLYKLLIAVGLLGLLLYFFLGGGGARVGQWEAMFPLFLRRQTNKKPHA